MVEFLVIGGKRYHDKQIMDSFPTEAEAETHKGLLMMEPTDEDLTFGVLKVNPGKVRKRCSYRLFKELLDFFSKPHSRKEILEYLYELLNSEKRDVHAEIAWHSPLRSIELSCFLGNFLFSKYRMFTI